MKKAGIIALITLFLAACNSDEHTYALIETDFGTMKVMLYNTTPRHRDNFIKLGEKGFYDDLLFHRVIEGFMIQGGDPDSKGAPAKQPLGMGGPGYQIDAEIGAPHIRGALAAARDGNPQKRSSGSQFYLVQGQPVNEDLLNQIEQQKGITYNDAQRQLYLTEGGAPFLDNDYTVFGEIVDGFEVLDKIAAVPTDPANRPLEDVKMKVSILR
jgi:cyclophilin family peptidyl-prolyl cis-trans isomerase